MSETTGIHPTSEKLWNVLCHLSIFLSVPLILPLIVYLVTKDDKESSIPQHARETLNFHISLAIYGLAGALLAIVLVGFVILGLVAIVGVVLSIIGAVKASNNELYRYPFTIRLVQ